MLASAYPVTYTSFEVLSSNISLRQHDLNQVMGRNFSFLSACRTDSPISYFMYYLNINFIQANHIRIFLLNQPLFLKINII